MGTGDPSGPKMKKQVQDNGWMYGWRPSNTFSEFGPLGAECCPNLKYKLGKKVVSLAFFYKNAQLKPVFLLCLIRSFMHSYYNILQCFKSLNTVKWENWLQVVQHGGRENGAFEEFQGHAQFSVVVGLHKYTHVHEYFLTGFTCL